MDRPARIGQSANADVRAPGPDAPESLPARNHLPKAGPRATGPRANDAAQSDSEKNVGTDRRRAERSRSVPLFAQMKRRITAASPAGTEYFEDSSAKIDQSCFSHPPSGLHCHIRPPA